MSILQVTPHKLIEHASLPVDDLHPRLSTIEAMRFIGGLSRHERADFQSISTGKVQEDVMRRYWTSVGDMESLAGHTASRSLQSARHLIELMQQDPDSAMRSKRFPHILQESNASKLHWDTHTRFRMGIGKVISKAVGAPEFDFPPLLPVDTVPDSERLVSYETGGVTILNEIQVTDEGRHIIGSNYYIEINP